MSGNFVTNPKGLEEPKKEETPDAAHWQVASDLKKDPSKVSVMDHNIGWQIGNLVLQSAGVSDRPVKGYVPVGTNFNGNPIYSDPTQSNSTDLTKGRIAITASGVALGTMGAFSNPKESDRFLGMGNDAANPEFHTKLDQLRTNKDVRGFVDALANIGGPSANKDSVDVSAYRLYEHWDSLSPAQKSTAISGVGAHGFTFDDGQTFQTKKVTPAVPNAPTLTAGEGLMLVSAGVNAAPATKKWDQITALQDTFHTPENGLGVVEFGNKLGLLGFGAEGSVVPISKDEMSKARMTPAPQYGVGAATIPVSGGVPAGYVKLVTSKDQAVIIPQNNQSTSVIKSPEVAARTSYNVYKNWPDSGDKATQTNGVEGGSAYVYGLSALSQVNPYSMGALMTYSSYHNTGAPKATEPLSHVTQMAGVTLSRLVDGKADASTDKKGLDYAVHGEFTRESYNSAMKQLRGEYSKQNITSKEVGYQLANQAYAEGRIDETKLVSMQRTLDMVFDENSYKLAQMFSSGKDKGLSIVETRRAGTVSNI